MPLEIIYFTVFLRFTSISGFSFFFFFNDTATTEIYTLSLHDALPISPQQLTHGNRFHTVSPRIRAASFAWAIRSARSEEHTSELQSLTNLVCRLLLEKKKTQNYLLFETVLLRTAFD